jgi:hypothetical protein
VIKDRQSVTSSAAPKRSEDLSAAWLTQALQESGTLTDAVVRAIDVQPLGTAGVGFLSGLARVGLQYDGPAENAPRSLVAKFPAVGETREIGDSMHAYEREIRFYREIAGRSQVPTLRCYGATLDAEQGAFVLLLEDGTGFRAGDQVRGLTWEEAEQCIRAIAPFHAQWWRQPELEHLTWMPLENMDLRTLFDQNWPDFRERFAPELTPAELEVGAHICRHGALLLELIGRRPHTLVHWDYRADNLLFDDVSPERPVVVLDWQLTERSLGAYDVARLIGGSLREPELDYRRLVALWHELLVAGGVSGYSLTDAWADFRISLLTLLYNPVSFFRIAEQAGKRGRALTAVMVHRLFHAAVACDAAAALDPK